MSTRRVVVVGSGGREHALALRLAADPEPVEVVVVPGNDGLVAPLTRRDASLTDLDGLVEACSMPGADLVVVGPEAPLAAGLVDRLLARGIPTLGPTRAGARIESSKWFAKEVMRSAGVPTADAERFEDLGAAEAALERLRPPWVVKADGLAAGKGVCVTADRNEALAFVRESLAGRFGEAGRQVLLERHLSGEELSVMAVCDGERAVLLPAARDYKRALDGDLGPNTGGMGAYAPCEALGQGRETFVLEVIVRPVLRELARRGVPYRGVLYAGLMSGPSGLQVVEFNARLGDPETQVALPLVEGSLFGLLASASSGRIDATAVRHRPGAVVAVAIVDANYPEPGGRGVIEDTGRLAELAGVTLLTAGVRGAGPGRWEITGGRAAYVRAEAATRDEARRRAYEAIDRLGGSGWRCRRDVAALPAGHPVS